MKRKNLLTCLFGVTSFLLTGIGFSLSNLTEVSINHDNTIEIKRLNSSTDPEGHVTYTFGYNVMPATATDMTCAMTLAYSDGADCSQVITGTLDPDMKKISVTNLAPFDKQIILTINSVADSTIKSTVTIDYEKKVLGGGVKDIEITESWQGFREFDLSRALDVQYSIYSLDKRYNFNLTSASCAVGDNVLRTSDESLNTKYADLLINVNHDLGGYYLDPIKVAQEATAEEEFAPAKWLSIAASSPYSNQWAKLLSDVVTNNASIVVQSNLTFDAGNSIVVGGMCNISFNLKAMNYTAQDFYTAVTSVEAESPSLVF